MFRRMLLVAALTAAPVLGISAMTAAQAAVPSATHTIHTLCSIYAGAERCAGAGVAPMIQQCQPPQGGTTYSSTSITVTDTQTCPPFVFKLNVSIWQFSTSNTWVEVASGTGSATYTCKGSTLRTHYETRTVDFGTDDFYDNCN